MNIIFANSASGEDISTPMEFGFKGQRVIVRRKKGDDIEGVIQTFTDGDIVVGPEEPHGIDEWSFIEWENVDAVVIR